MFSPGAPTIWSSLWLSAFVGTCELSKALIEIPISVFIKSPRRLVGLVTTGWPCDLSLLDKCILEESCKALAVALDGFPGAPFQARLCASNFITGLVWSMEAFLRNQMAFARRGSWRLQSQEYQSHELLAHLTWSLS